MKLWFRFGLPLGSAFITATILDTAVAFYWLMNDAGSLFYFYTDHDIALNFGLIFGVICFSLRAILALLLWVFVLLGYRSMLVVWIPMSVIIDLLFFGQAIFSEMYYIHSDEVWFFNLAVVFLLRFYIYLVVAQCLHRLMKNENQNAENPSIEEQPNNYLHLEPIGKDILEIWKYYNGAPVIASTILLITELVWNIFTLSTNYLTEFMLGGRIFFMPREEEMIIRYWRIIIDAIALIFIINKNKTLLRFWLIIYFWTLFVSICIYGYEIFVWVDTPYVVYVITSYIFLADNVLRFGVLYFCLEVTCMKSEIPSRRNSRISSQSESRSVRQWQ